jgi:hypothetical protein
MHPLWQVKQIVTAPNGQRHVDRCNNFGGAGSCKIWLSFMALVIWIAIFIKHLDALKLYVDDTYGFECTSKMAYYAPYSTWYPAKQVALLLLWDELGLPHDQPKQVFGSPLEIIGLLVDPNVMTVSLPDHKRRELVDHINVFAARAEQRWPLREFLRLAGWCNWAFNVYPLLAPGLSALYDKVRGKKKLFAPTTVNQAIITELRWLAQHVESLPGVFLLESLSGNPYTDDAFVAFVDAASTEGLGVFFPSLELGFQFPGVSGGHHINFLELLSVCSAVHLASKLPVVPQRLAIFTDSTFAVDVFHSLRARPPHNSILMSTVDVLLAHSIDLRVVHIPGALNCIADALSRFNNDAARVFAPLIDIQPFSPPRGALGVLPC